MLKKFAVKGFKGFKDRIELDLSFHKNYEFNTDAIQNGIIKDGIIYGPNGSGKSNLGFAIFDIVNHLSQKMKATPIYENSIYAGNPDGSMDFEYCFDFDGYELCYEYSKNQKNELISEKLLYNGDLKFSRSAGSFSIDKTEFPIAAETENALKENSNRISVVGFLLATFPLPSNHYLIQLKNFVDSMLWFRCLEDRGFIGLMTKGQILDEFIIENGLLSDFKRFLKDVSDQDYNFAVPEKGDKTIYCIIDGNRIRFRDVQSTGTSSLELLYYWTKNLDRVSLLFIDEFDAFYHYKLSSEICRRLFSLKCQVLLTSHNTFLMSNDILRPDCNFIINGNKIKPLCACTDKELRWGHNIEKLFRGGAFEL